MPLSTAGLRWAQPLALQAIDFVVTTSGLHTAMDSGASVNQLESGQAANWLQFLSEPMIAQFGDGCRVSAIAEQPLPPGETRVADGVAKFLVQAADGANVAVALCASPASPMLVKRGMDNARDVQKKIGPELGAVILKPVYEGEHAGLSCAVLPFCQTLSGNKFKRRWQMMRLRPHLLSWLRGVTERTVEVPKSVESSFEVPLKNLATDERLPESIHRVAEFTLSELSSGRWEPRHVVAHNDLWEGNVLLDDRDVTGRPGVSSAMRFVVIDWPGASVSGYAVMDLLRFCRAFRASDSLLVSELKAHCQILGCDASQAVCHLASGLGAIFSNLEHFPLPMFIRMAEYCIGRLESLKG